MRLRRTTAGLLPPETRLLHRKCDREGLLHDAYMTLFGSMSGRITTAKETVLEDSWITTTFLLPQLYARRLDL